MEKEEINKIQKMLWVLPNCAGELVVKDLDEIFSQEEKS